ncbi:arabinosyltransferase domain-containing protein [Mycobacterium sp. smrl_JER01]|uniref:arabinosyltransferase domain-containing protein n=1 Tax=Mycobacterium sp. smrl_JER01 TaxID=3402633 RepID=UPI003ACB056C
MVQQAASVEPTRAVANHRTVRLIAIVAGLLGTMLAVATPFLPVNQTTAELNWPQEGVLGSVDAPLIGYVATDLEITVPCSAAAGLDRPGRTVLLSTVPKQAPNAVDRGLLIERVNDDLLVIVRNTPVVSAPLDQVLSPACDQLRFTAHADRVTGEFVGLQTEPEGAGQEPSAEPLRGERSGYDFRPQIVGVFTDLSGPAPPGLEFSATIDTRYSTSPTLLKLLAMIVGVAMTVIALGALHVLDRADGRRHKRFLPPRWWSLTPLDGLVAAVLVWWHFVGANTADDGYILTMARVSEGAGYMANYYRWFGTPEAPFGWYYDLLALWANVSTTSVWMRLPTLLMGLACWWVISREVLPRLGTAVKHSQAAAWTAAGLFLAFWLPLNNGLRPEPIIALGILLTWCSVERGVATSRLLPVAVAIIIGALTLFSGPTGIAAIGALLVAIGPLKTIVAAHVSRFGYLALLAPIAAAGTVTIFLIFRDQTLASELQASSFKSAVGPSLAWFDEHIRYSRLFTTSPDGSVARRFAVLTLLLALAVAVAMTLRKGRIPGTATGPTLRIIGISVISFLAMMFTPTKWTHHFGVFAGLAGSLGALAAVAISAAAMRSPRNRAMFTAAVLFLTALSFATVNGWWYVSNFGVPWSNAFPEWKFGFTTMLLGLSLVALLVAAWLHFSGRDVPSDVAPPRWKRITQAPLAIVTWALVIFQVFSLTVAMLGQYPAWTVGRSNLQALTGKTCGMAEDVLVEPDANAGMLTPIGVAIGDALGEVTSDGFRPNGIPSDVSADPVMEQPGSDNFADSDGSGETGNEAGTEGGTTAAAGVNGSRARLPYGLDPATTPVLGSWRSGTQQPAFLRSAWYQLPPGWNAQDRSESLLVISAAGRFDASEVVVQWAGPDGEPAGSIEFGDVGAAPAWRNLRAPLSAIPAEATRIRLVASDDDLSPEHWIAVTPPRIPELRTLQDVVGSSDPVLLDWLVGLAFPCQRPFGHRNGVIEVPQWRILPDRFGAEANSPVMDYLGGGPLGITELLFRAMTVPTYLKDDWFRDWGALQRLVPFYPDAEPARLDLGTEQRSGLWSPAPLRLS